MPTTEPATLSLADLDDNKLEAVIETLFLAAYADGDFSDEEKAHFRQSVETISSGRASGDVLTRIETSAQGDRTERLAAIRKTLTDVRTRELALSLAIKLMAADGIIRTSERELIIDLAEGLEIDRDRAADMVKGASAGLVTTLRTTRC